MLNEKEPGERGKLSSDPSINNIVKKPSRQEGILPSALWKGIRLGAAGVMSWLAAESTQPLNSQVEANTDPIPPYSRPFSIPARILDISANLSPNIVTALQQGEVIRRIAQNGQELTWSVIHDGGDPNPIVFQFLFYNYQDPQQKLTQAQEIVSSFLTRDVIKDHQRKFMFIGRTDNNIEDLLCGIKYGNPSDADCKKEPYTREVKKSVESGVIATESAVIIKSNSRGGTGWADITTNFNIIPPIDDFIGLVWSSENQNPAKYNALLHELLHNLGVNHPIQGTPEYEKSLIGIGLELLPEDAARLRAILTSNQNNPNARYVFPQFQLYSLRDGSATRVVRSVHPIQGLRELDTGILAISPTAVKQIYLRRVPALGDGAMLEYYFGSQEVIHALGEIGLRHPEPVRGVSEQNTLGGMTYTWEAKVSPLQEKLVIKLPDGTEKANWNDPRWNEFEIWPGKRILIPTKTLVERPPAPTSTSISNASPEIVSTLTPALKWKDAKTNQFYYEVQMTTQENVGPDGEFISNPNKALGPLYWELIHGGETKNTYQVRPEFKLESGKTYKWRVRPRVQADGIPVTWSQTWKFKTP